MEAASFAPITTGNKFPLHSHATSERAEGPDSSPPGSPGIPTAPLAARHLVADGDKTASRAKLHNFEAGGTFKNGFILAPYFQWRKFRLKGDDRLVGAPTEVECGG